MCIALLIQIEPAAHRAGGVSLVAIASHAFQAGRTGKPGSSINISQQETQTTGISTGF
jgi:hypothetical protein